MKWPEKKYVLTGNCTNEDYAQGYNAAIEECKAAYAKEARLVALDKQSVRLCLVNSTQQNWKSDYDLAAQAICDEFGSSAIPTEDDIRSMLDGFNVNKSMEIAKFIHRRLLESKT